MAQRIWDKYLTEQDKAHLSIAGHRSLGYGEKPALLLVDLYRWVFGVRPEPLLQAVKKWPSSCGLAGWNALPYIQDLLKASREAGIPVIHISGLEESAGIGEWYNRYDPSKIKKLDPEVEAYRSRRYDIMDEVAPIPGEAVLRKTAPSAFWGTPLLFHLTRLGIDTLLICGESTSGCVRSTVVDACTNRYKVIVPEECVFDRHEATHAINLFDMHQKYADVVPLTVVLKYLKSRRGTAVETRAAAKALG